MGTTVGEKLASSVAAESADPGLVPALPLPDSEKGHTPVDNSCNSGTIESVWSYRFSPSECCVPHAETALSTRRSALNIAPCRRD